MKSLFCLTVVLSVILFCFSQSTQAQNCEGTVYYGSFTWQTANQVHSYSTTYLDYCAGLYYDPALFATFAEIYPIGIAVIGDGYSQGYGSNYPAEFNGNYVSPINGGTYNTTALHYVIAYYEVYECFGNCGYYYFDPWRFGFIESGGGYEVPWWYGGYTYYVFYLVAVPIYVDTSSQTIVYQAPGCSCQPGQPLAPGCPPCPNPTPTPPVPPFNPVSGCSSSQTSLGGIIASEPTAGVIGNRIVAFARGTDNVIYYQHSTGGAFSGWISVFMRLD